MLKSGLKLFTLGLAAVAVCMLALPAAAQTGADVVGSWQIVTQVQGNENRSTITIEEKDGVLTGQASGRGGATEMLNLTYEGGVLKWGIKVPQLGNQELTTEVTVKGDVMEGAMDTPLGKLPVNGKRVSEEDVQALANREKALLGDWNVYTDFNGEVMASEMRFERSERDGDLEAQIIMRGSRMQVNRMSFDGENLRLMAGIPFISEEPAALVAKLDETGKVFNGTLTCAFGEFKVTMEVVDTAKLVVAPYDDPKPILGAWEMEAEIEGQVYPAELTVEERDFQIFATITSDTGSYESKHMDYAQVNETMGSIRMEIDIPDLNAETQVIEIIVDGDTFEGEEMNSDGKFIVRGKRK